MKFSDIKKDQWADLQPYLDTCLVPLTGLTGGEEPWEVTQALERLADIMEPVEIPFKGRVVTYPSLHYNGQPGSFVAGVNHLCGKLREGGFAYVILISADPAISIMSFEGADLFLSAEDASGGKALIGEKLQEVWRREKEKLTKDA
ncbi:DUF2487 family protein [Paenibacillus sp. MBLB4367]|uniref:DUF2487 family protein n=1 Tax=Paenibacillus sp. MBLB4367 TaxID=3384767 RepID=UPI00390800A3